MSWSEIIGQPVAVRQLQNAVKRDRIGHAYLFYGPAGVGKRTTARIFAQTLNCLESGTGDVCGQCRSCLQSKAGNHPDILEITPMGTSIRIQQIRDLSREALFRPLAGRHKIFLILGAENMTLEAANNLLKILEEPPAYVVFILTTTANLRLLPTILSRCQQIRFAPLTVQAIENYLVQQEAVDPVLARQMAHLAGGSLSEAMELRQEIQTEKSLREAALEMLTQMEEEDSLAALLRFKPWEERSQVKLLLQVLGLWFRDLMIWQKTAEERLLVNQDRLDLIRRHAHLWKQADQVLSLIQDARQKLEKNANIPLLLEVFLLELFEYRGGLVSASRSRGPL